MTVNIQIKEGAHDYFKNILAHLLALGKLLMIGGGVLAFSQNVYSGEDDLVETAERLGT
jgi:hypothetical protein